jgi:hypothetical protein
VDPTWAMVISYRQRGVSSEQEGVVRVEHWQFSLVKEHSLILAFCLVQSRLVLPLATFHFHRYLSPGREPM